MTAHQSREPISPELVLVDPELACPPDELETVMIDSPNGPPDDAQPSLETLMFTAGLIDADQLGELVREAVVSGRSIEALALERNLVTPEAVELLVLQPEPQPEPQPAPEAVVAPPVFPAQPELVEPDVHPHIALAVEPEPVVEPAADAAACLIGVVVRLTSGETVHAGGAESRESAEDLARTIARQFADASEWPLVAGRCLRPDLVVSVDVVCGLEDG